MGSLDDYYIYERAETKVMDLYMKVIFNHLNNNLPFDYLRKSHELSPNLGDELGQAAAA
jgi:hypothetical protein